MTTITHAQKPIALPKHKPALRALKARLAADKRLIEINDVQVRIRNAILTLNSLPDPDLRFLRVRCGLPEMVREALDAADAQSQRNEELNMPRKFHPSPQDMDRYLDDLNWVNPLTRQERDILAWRARDFSNRDIGQWLNMTEGQAANAYKSALSNCWCVAALAQREAIKTSA